jgi:lauroyl/myristoyl acyltransferase
MDLTATGCDDGRWIQLAQDRVQRQVLVLGLLESCVLLPVSLLIGETVLTDLCREGGRWIELAQYRVQKQALTDLNAALPERQ